MGKGLKTTIFSQSDQPGSFVVLSLRIVATLYSSGNQMVFKLPVLLPFITFLIACLMNIFNVDFHEYRGLFQKIGKWVTPLALLSVGLQLRLNEKSQH
jgi:predicted permease